MPRLANLSECIGESPWLSSLMTLVSVTAYHSFGGEVEASTPHVALLLSILQRQVRSIRHSAISPLKNSDPISLSSTPGSSLPLAPTSAIKPR